MQTTIHKSVCLSLCMMSQFTVWGQEGAGNGPVYDGKPLAAWVDRMLESLLGDITYTNRSDVQAVRSIGTNAIPWLLSELTATPWRGGSNVLHQNRARYGFWALGEIGAPAVPSLVNLVEQQPDAVPSALAGIGVRGLPAIVYCLTNNFVDLRPNGFHAQIPISALGGLFVAIDAKRISTNEAFYLLPLVRTWTQSTNREAAFWAEGVMEKLSPESITHN